MKTDKFTHNINPKCLTQPQGPYHGVPVTSPMLPHSGDLSRTAALLLIPHSHQDLILSTLETSHKPFPLPALLLTSFSCGQLLFVTVRFWARNRIHTRWSTQRDLRGKGWARDIPEGAAPETTTQGSHCHTSGSRGKRRKWYYLSLVSTRHTGKDSSRRSCNCERQNCHHRCDVRAWREGQGTPGHLYPSAVSLASVSLGQNSTGSLRAGELTLWDSQESASPGIRKVKKSREWLRVGGGGVGKWN